MSDAASLALRLVKRIEELEKCLPHQKTLQTERSKEAIKECKVSRLNETWLDTPWASPAPYSKRELCNRSLGSRNVHERIHATSALVPDLCNPRSWGHHCLVGWWVANKGKS